MIIMMGGGKWEVLLFTGSGEQVLGGWRSCSSPSSTSWLEATPAMADCPDFFNVVHEVPS